MAHLLCFRFYLKRGLQVICFGRQVSGKRLNTATATNPIISDMPRPRSNPDKKVETRIAELRAMKGYSIAVMAEKVNANLQTYHDVETGKTRLSLDWMRRIARALECAPSDLLLPQDLAISLSDEEQQLVHHYRLLDVDRQKIVPGLIASLHVKLSA
jgi:DNA-binding XRE family transcriptional regulator